MNDPEAKAGGDMMLVDEVHGEAEGAEHMEQQGLGTKAEDRTEAGRLSDTLRKDAKKLRYEHCRKGLC